MEDRKGFSAAETHVCHRRDNKVEENEAKLREDKTEGACVCACVRVCMRACVHACVCVCYKWEGSWRICRTVRGSPPWTCNFNREAQGLKIRISYHGKTGGLRGNSLALKMFRWNLDFEIVYHEEREAMERPFLCRALNRDTLCSFSGASFRVLPMYSEQIAFLYEK